MPGKDGMDLCWEIRQFSNMSNRVFSRSELINRVQGYDFEGYDRTIDSHIKNLRKKIAQQLPGQEIISTAYGIGYKSTASSKKISDPQQAPSKVLSQIPTSAGGR